MGVETKIGTPDIVPKITGFPYSKDLNKAPPNFGNPHVILLEPNGKNIECPIRAHFWGWLLEKETWAENATTGQPRLLLLLACGLGLRGS